MKDKSVILVTALRETEGRAKGRNVYHRAAAG